MPDYTALSTNQQSILDARDILAGSMGAVWCTLPDGRRMCAMQVKNIEASVSYEKEQVAILGKRGKGNRKTGETYSGSMTLWYVDSSFRKLAEQYKNSGLDFYYDLEVTNNDPTSKAGSQIVVLRDVNFDELILTKLDADSAVLDEDVSFTFEDWLLDTAFNELDGLFPSDASAAGTQPGGYPMIP